MTRERNGNHARLRSEGPYPIEEPDQSLGDLVGRLTSEMGALFNDHLQLARIEIMEDLKEAGKGAGLMGGAGVAGWIAALILSLALCWGLAEFMPTWLAFLVVGVVWAVVAGVTAMAGRKQLRQVDPMPNQTMDELERDREWLKQQRN